MKTVLYVFSATGNCLTTARKMAAQMEDCRIIPVAQVNKARKVKEDAQCVGFLFPVYYGNMPYPVRELVSKMVFENQPYIFAVTTCRGHVGVAPQRLDQLLRTRGQRLALAENVTMPGNSYLNTEQQDAAALAAQDENVKRVLTPILRREIRDYSVKEILPLTPVDYPNNFRGVTAEDHCIGCGICRQVCPMGNITIADGKAIIGDNCATCLACFHWCPQEAIWMSKQEDIGRRKKYRHPDVKLKDFIHSTK